MLQYKEEINTTKLKCRMLYKEEEQTGKVKCTEIRKGIDLINAQTTLAGGEISQKITVICNNRDFEAALKIAEIKAETVWISMGINAHCDAEIAVINAEKTALRMKLDAITDETRVSAEAKKSSPVRRVQLWLSWRNTASTCWK